MHGRGHRLTITIDGSLTSALSRSLACSHSIVNPDEFPKSIRFNRNTFFTTKPLQYSSNYSIFFQHLHATLCTIAFERCNMPMYVIIRSLLHVYRCTAMADWWIHHRGMRCGVLDSQIRLITMIMSFSAAAMQVIIIHNSNNTISIILWWEFIYLLIPSFRVQSINIFHVCQLIACVSNTATT